MYKKDLCYDEDDKKCGPRDINIAFKDTDTNEPATESNPIWSTFDKKLKAVSQIGDKVRSKIETISKDRMTINHRFFDEKFDK